MRVLAVIAFMLVLAPLTVVAAEVDSGVVVLRWSREGGFAGFCDHLEIDEGGLAVASRCGGRAPTEAGRCRLDDEERTRLARWLHELAPFEWEHRDPAVADAMTLRLRFAGRGDREVTADERQAMLDLAGAVFARASR